MTDNNIREISTDDTAHNDATTDTTSDKRENVKPPSERFTKSRSTDNTTTDTETTETSAATCPECNSQTITDDKHGETVCEHCGLVVAEDEIDPGPEWRAFDNDEDDKSRVGAPTTNMMHDKGLSTNIDWQNKDAYGNQLSSRQREKMQRLRKWNERFRARTPQERNLRQALGEIDRMASALGIPDNVREMASKLYQRCLDKNMLPGRSIEAMATASLYAACRIEQLPHSPTDFERVSRIDTTRRIMSGLRYMSTELELKLKPVDPERYLPKYTNELDLTPHTERLAERLLDKVKEHNLHSGKSPSGIAAGVLFLACKLNAEHISQTAIGDVSDNTPVTVRERKDEIVNHEDSDDWIKTLRSPSG